MAGLEDLKIYNMACKLEKEVYTLADKFPRDEKYRQVGQIKRASAPVCDNIAEDYGRYSYQNKIQLFYTARAGATEVKSQLERVISKNFIAKSNKYLIEKYTELIKGINGYIGFLKNRKEKLAT